MYKLVVTPDMTLYDAFRKTASVYKVRPAVTCGDRTLTYQEILDRINALAAKLRDSGLGPGGRMVLLLPNGLEFVFAFLAPAALGAVVIPLDPTLKPGDLIHILQDSECSHVLMDPDCLDEETRAALESARPALPGLRQVLSISDLPLDSGKDAEFKPVSPDAPAAFFYTSGTTGVAKAVVHSHRTLLSALTQGKTLANRSRLGQIAVLFKFISRHGLRVIGGFRRQAVSMSTAPLHLLMGYGSLFGCLFTGGRFVINDSSHPGRILELIEKERVLLLFASPTMALALMKSRDLAKRDLSSLWVLGLTSAPCSAELALRAERAFGCSVYMAFGATEIGGTSLQTSAFDSQAKRMGTVGRATMDHATRIVDDEHRDVPVGQIGELAHRLPSIMLGYHNAPELTAGALDAEGWYYTGDLAVCDEKGFIRIAGRKKDMVIRAGQNIFPAEIEQFLLGQEGVKNAAAIGRPDPVLGETLWLYVEPQEGATLTAESIMALCRERLSPSKRPDGVKIVDSLPLTSSGKVKKYMLKETDRSHE